MFVQTRVRAGMATQAPSVRQVMYTVCALCVMESAYTSYTGALCQTGNVHSVCLVCDCVMESAYTSYTGALCQTGNVHSVCLVCDGVSLH